MDRKDWRTELALVPKTNPATRISPGGCRILIGRIRRAAAVDCLRQFFAEGGVVVLLGWVAVGIGHHAGRAEGVDAQIDSAGGGGTASVFGGQAAHGAVDVGGGPLAVALCTRRPSPS